MGHNNYQGFFNKSEDKTEQKSVAPVEETLENETTQIEETSIVEEVAPVEEPVEEAKQEVTGKVSGCELLNVRKEGLSDATILCVVPKDSEVQLVLDESTDEFYKVVTPSGIEGYCMKKFIEMK